MYFRYFVIISHWKRGAALHLNKPESPSPKDALCQVWLAQWFLRRRFLNFINVFLPFRNYLPLEKDETLHLNKFESPLSKYALCQVWLKLVQWFWRTRWKCEKFTKTLATTDDGQRTNFEQKLWLRWAKNSYTAKWSATGVSVTGPRRWPLLMDVPCHCRCGTLKKPHCSCNVYDNRA